MFDYQSVLSDAVCLPVTDRIELIEALWETIPAGSLPPLSDEWLGEIKRRSEEYDSGSVRTVPWEQIRADALRRVGATDTNVAG